MAGKSWTPIKGAPGGDDYHQLWISPEDSNRMMLASDQGAIVTVDGAATWSSWYNQSTAQLYHVAADSRFPYWVTGAQQDSGAVGTPSRSPHGVISMHDWTGLCAGGESGYTAPDPLHPEILFGGTVTRCNVLTGASQNVSPERGQPAPGPPRVDAAAGLLAGRSARALLREPVPLQDDQRRRDLDADQPGPDARGSRRAAESRRGGRRRRPGREAPRRHLHDRAVARSRARSSGSAPTTG